MPPRRFPPPWSVEDTGACFVVKDGGGQELGYFYYEEEPGGGRRLAGVSRIETVFRAHVGDDCEVLAASAAGEQMGRGFYVLLITRDEAMSQTDAEAWD